VIEVSVIIPTLNEGENLPILLPQIGAALAGRAYEVIIVDDGSRDNTPGVCAELAKQFPLELIVRPAPKDGLSGAILLGMSRAKGEFFVVMDGDLQHPPGRIPDLLAPLAPRRGEATGFPAPPADFVIGSRYIPGGSTAEKWGLGRRINSWVATQLARPFAGPVHDPMSGFFALRRESYAAARRLTPLGYKIGLELMCKCRVRHVAEIPIHFALRQHGQSKLTLAQQVKYLEHLSRLYDYTFPRAVPLAKFLIVLAISWLFALVCCLMFLQFGMPLPAAVTGSYPGVIAVTAVFHFRYIRTQREFILRPRPWLDFWRICAGEWASCTAAAFWLSHRLADPTPASVFLLSFAVAAVVRYILRKELLQDVRGLRRDIRAEDLLPPTR
jgi:dolichol-phosphate mannosyltransferase